MRSGNMAAHYEVSGIPPITYLTAPLSGSTTTLSANILITYNYPCYRYISI